MSQVFNIANKYNFYDNKYVAKYLAMVQFGSGNMRDASSLENVDLDFILASGEYPNTSYVYLTKFIDDRYNRMNICDIYNEIRLIDPDYNLELYVYVYSDTLEHKGITMLKIIENLNSFYNWLNPDNITETFDREGNVYNQLKIRVSDRLLTNRKRNILIYREIQESRSELSKVNLNFWVRSKMDIVSKDIQFKPQLKYSELGIDISHMSKEYYEKTYTMYSTRLKIFDEIVASVWVPYVHYIDEDDKSYYKFYTEYSSTKYKYYRKITEVEPEVKTTPVIYATLWTGDINNTDPKSIIDSEIRNFILVEFDLKTGILYLKVISDVRGSIGSVIDIAITRLKSAFPMLELGGYIDSRIQCQYNLYPIYENTIKTVRGVQVVGHEDESQFQLVNYAFNSLMMMENTFKSSLYVDESISPIAMRKKIDYNYMEMYSNTSNANKLFNPTLVSFNMKVISTSTDTMVESYHMINGKDLPTRKSYKLDNGYNYITIRTTKINDINNIESFDNGLKALLYLYYFDHYLEFKRNKPSQHFTIYRDIIPGIDSMKVSHVKKKRRAIKPKRYLDDNVNIDKLKQDYQELYPTVFGDQYFNMRSQYIPIIFETEEEVKKYVNDNKFLKDGELVDRIYLGYPPVNPIFYFASANNKFPYPGVVINDTGYNQLLYPYLPKCYAKDQSLNSNSDYNVYYTGIIPKKMERVNINNSAKAMPVGIIGTVPDMITNIFKQTGMVYDLRRIGLIRDNNNLLHAVLYAANEIYYNINNDESRIKLANETRSLIAEAIGPEALKQELYDLSLDEIRNELASPEIKLTAERHLRAIELYYNINIIVLQSTERNNVENIDIMEPRSNNFHIRNIENFKQTIVLYNHLGTVSDNLNEPINEIIFSLNFGKIERSFGSTISTAFNDIVNKSNWLLTYIPNATRDLNSAIETKDNKIFKTNNSSDMYGDLYVNCNIDIIIKSKVSNYIRKNVKPISQYIDDSGKRRCTSWIIKNNNTTSRVTLWHSPSIPLNIVHTTDWYNMSIDYMFELFVTRTSRIYISGYSLTDGNNQMVDGIWIYHNYAPDMIYIPLIANPDNLNRLKPYMIKDCISYNPFKNIVTEDMSIDDPTIRLRELRRTLELILELIMWVFDIWRIHNMDKDVSAFANQYFRYDINSSNVDSLVEYDTKKVNYILPNPNNIDEALKYLHDMVPGLSKYDSINDVYYIWIYNLEFMKGIQYELYKYYKMTASTSITKKLYINNYYNNSRYFKKHPGVDTTIGDDFNKWLSNVSRTMTYDTIYNIIDPTMANSTIPYIYEDEAGQILLIQNPESGTLPDAYVIAKKWILDKRNIGSKVPLNDRISVEDCNTLTVYGILPSNKITPLYAYKGDSEINVYVLYYGNSEIDSTHRLLDRHSVSNTGIMGTNMSITSKSSFMTFNSSITIIGRYAAIIRLM